LFVGRAKAGAELEHNEQKVVYDEWPFSSISVTSDTEDDGTN
jgi:hypothetical protein